MSRVITYSRVFPAYHPKAGQPTNFIRKILKARHLSGHLSAFDILKISREIGLMGLQDLQSVHRFLSDPSQKPKHTTIRAGKNWKVGDKFSPRAWSAKPYASKQLHLGPDITISDVHDFELRFQGSFRHIYMDGELFGEINPMDDGKFDVTGDLFTMASNDGLDLPDLMGWFNKPFVGQIICWTPNLYS